MDLSAKGDYTTHHVTKAVQAWITKQITALPGAKTFAYVAHEAVHGPLEAPVSYGPLHNRSVAHRFLLAAFHSEFTGEQ